MLSFLINDYDWPSDPWSFKYTNLLLHLLIAVLVFGFSRTLAGLRTTTIRADLAALIVTAAWLLHPMQLSTSMLVVQRMTQLSALFVFAGLWAYLALATRAHRLLTSIVALAALCIGTVLALLCKETGALAPLLAVVINATVLRERLYQLPTQPRRVLQWGAALPVLVLLTAIAWRWDALTDYRTRGFDMGERLLTQARVLINYLYQILIPNLRGGGIYHDDFAISHSLLQPWTTLPAVLLVAGMLLGAIVHFRRWPLFGFATLWYFGGQLLESSVFPLEIYFEHRNYLPMFGPLFALSLWTVEARLPWRKPILAIACVWIAFACWLTYVQAPIWGNRRALVTVWAIEHPQSPRAVQQQADFLYREGDFKQAAKSLVAGYERGVRGSDFPVQVLLIACIQRDPNLAARARKWLPEALGSGEYTEAMGLTLSKLRNGVQNKNCPDQLTDNGWLTLTDQLLDNPNYALGDVSAYLHIERAYFFRRRRNLNATMAEFEAAWAAKPSPELAQLIAATLASAGLYNQAEVWARRGLEHQTTGIRGWLSQDDIKSRNLLDALQNAKQAELPDPQKP